MAKFEEAGAKFAELLEIMARLRAPGGCPWDRKQTFDTIKPYLLEETYEVLDAIDARDWPGLEEELGDLLLQPVFFAEMAREAGYFDIAGSLEAINRKLIRRHPHIFAEGTAETPEEVKKRWDEIKREERAERGLAKPASMLDAVPRNLPALTEADKIGRRAAKAGFEWPEIGGVLAKIQEEAAELAEAHTAGNAQEMEHELGDLLFSVVNLAHYLAIDPEQALRKTSGRFRRRFAHIERELEKRGATVEAASLNEMEELWQAAKKLEPPPAPPAA